MKKILLTWAKGMLGTDFIRYVWDKFDIFAVDKENGDITDIKKMEALIKEKKSDIIVNFAAYTNVEDAEDIGIKDNFDINAIWVYNLAKISAKYDIDFITLSTDYVFDGAKKTWYNENDISNPINNYGMAKYLWENLAEYENPKSVIIRTSRLYGWWQEYIERRNSKGDIEIIPRYKNFVNTMIKLGKTKKELSVVNDQFWSPTYTKDLCKAIDTVISQIDRYRWKILHFSNETPNNGINWFEFASEIFTYAEYPIKLQPCSSGEFPSKVNRPQYSKLVNTSDIHLRNRKEALHEYIKEISKENPKRKPQKKTS